MRPRLDLRPPTGVVGAGVELLNGFNEEAHSPQVRVGGSVGVDGSIYTSSVGFSIYIILLAPILER